MDPISPETSRVWLERQLADARRENSELKCGKRDAEERCVELEHQVALLDRLRVAAICRQAIQETRRRNPCAHSRRLEIAALDRVMTDCEDELQEFRAWKAELQDKEKNQTGCAHGSSAGARGGYYEDESHQAELSTLRRLLSETEEEIRSLRLVALEQQQQQQQWVQSNQRPEEYLSPEEQQAIIHERDRLQSELAHCQADLQELQHSASRVQQDLQASIGESDDMIHTVLEKMAKVQSRAEEDAETIDKNLKGGSHCTSQIRQRLEAMKEDILLVDLPGVAFGSRTGRTLDPQLLKRLLRHTDSIGGILDKLESALESSRVRARSVSIIMSRESSPLPSPTVSTSPQHQKAAGKAQGEVVRHPITEPEQLVPVLEARSICRDDFVVPLPDESRDGHEQPGDEELPSFGRAKAEAAPGTDVMMSTAAPPTPPRLDVGASMNPPEAMLQPEQQQNAATAWGDLPLKQQSRRPKSPLSRSTSRETPLFVAAHGDDLLQETRLSSARASGETKSRVTFQLSPPPAPFGCWADVAREVKGHLARLDELLDGDADRYAGEELRRLRASLQQILSDADGANVNVDSLRRCLTEMMQLMGANQTL